MTTNQPQATRVRTLTVTALFMAIILLQTQIPFLGYIPLGAFIIGVAPTIIQFTVAIGTIVLGTKQGLILAGFFGTISFVRGWTNPVSIGALMFQNPLTAIGARLMIAVVIGIFARKFIIGQTGTKLVSRLAVAGFLAAFTNTFFVVLSTWIGFNVMHTSFVGIPDNNLLHWLLISIVGVNGIAEMAVGIFYVPAIAAPLLAFLKHRN